jgi:hypothetical protein
MSDIELATAFDYAPLGNSAETVKAIAKSERIGEEWRGISGFSDYQVSNQGRVRSFKRAAALVLTLKKSPQGYQVVGLSIGGTAKWMTVHSLVCAAFIGARPERYQINHKNGIKTDNWPENLEYITPKANTRHAHRMGLVGKRKKRGAKK